MDYVDLRMIVSDLVPARRGSGVLGYSLWLVSLALTLAVGCALALVAVVRGGRRVAGERRTRRATLQNPRGASGAGFATVLPFPASYHPQGGSGPYYGPAVPGYRHVPPLG